MEKKKSVEVRLIGRIVLLFGILKLILTIFNIFIGIPSVRFSYVGGNISHLYNIMFLGAAVGLIFSICYIIFALGILRLKRWGYFSLILFLSLQRFWDIAYKFISMKYSDTDFFVNLGLFLDGLNPLFYFSSPFSPFYLLILLFNFAILIFIIYFFTRPKVKEQFK